MNMILCGKSVISYLILILTGIVSGVTICLVNNPIVHISVMWSVCVIACIIVSFDIMHPYCWFSIIFSLYSTAYAILYVMGARNYGYNYQNILFPVISLIVVLFVVGPKKKPKSKQNRINRGIGSLDNKYFSWIVYALVFLIIVSSGILLSRGYSGKKDMQAANDLFYRLGVYFCRFLTMFTLFRTQQLAFSGKKYYRMLAVSFGAIMLFGLCTGERDTYLRFFIVVLFLLYSIGKIKKRHFILLVPICVFVLVFSVGFKYFFSQGVEAEYFTANILETFLNADFYAAGQNLQYLLDRQWTKGYWGLETLLTEIFYPFIPGGFKTNLDYWFNYVVHFGEWHGYAFTLVGTGYVIAGLIGIVATFIFVGLFVRLLYKYSNKNTLMHTIYIYSITIVMISCRGTLSSYSNSLIKEILVSYIIVYMMEQMLIRHSRI